MKIEEASIMVVDDEPELLEIYAGWLTGTGCADICTAGDGEEALAAFRERGFDLLISDINMPRMDGMGLLRALRQLGHTMPGIIFVSGYDAADRAEMTLLGVEAFLAKPIRRAELTAATQEALARRERPVESA